MLDARYLASCADDIVKLYAQLEEDILIAMAERMAKFSKPTYANYWQAKILKEAGGLHADIRKILSRYDDKAQKQIVLLFEYAMQNAKKKDFEKFNIAGRELSGSQKQILNATMEKLQSAGIVTGSRKVKEDVSAGGAIKVFNGLQRLTMTIADTASNDFVQEANRAYMQVATGAFDYNTAIKNSVDRLAKQGIHTVEYTDSGKQINRTIESAVRTNVMTGINQTASMQTLDNCSTLETDLVEVDAHLGARPEHEAWQGQVYCLNGERDYIDGNGNVKHARNFYEVCHLGEPTGICGINCRHSYYPYFEGQPLEYSAGELNEFKEQTVKYNGQDISLYDAEQKLRLCERNIRRYKRTIDALETIGSDSAEDKALLMRWENTAADLCKQTGIRRDKAREYIGK